MSKIKLDDDGDRAAIVEAALGLAANKQWVDVTLGEIAERADMSLVRLGELFHSKLDILSEYTYSLDRKILSENDPDMDDESAKDRLFDVLMRRFDLMESQKKSIVSIYADSLFDPTTLWQGRHVAWQSMGAMLDAAKLGNSGLSGMFKVRGLFVIVAAVMQVWLKDDTADLSKTMAELDKRLSQANNLVGRVDGFIERVIK
jgi:AcrR family transcriptional regulator